MKYYYTACILKYGNVVSDTQYRTKKLAMRAIALAILDKSANGFSFTLHKDFKPV